MEQDQGSYSPEAGRTWPGWKVLQLGNGDMTTVRTDSVAFADTAMRLGTILLSPDFTVYIFGLFDEKDPNQGGTLFEMVRKG